MLVNGRYNLVETRRARPASAFQTMTQMSGMLVKRAPGGVPEPLEVDTNLGTVRPVTADAKPNAHKEKLKRAEELTIQGKDEDNHNFLTLALMQGEDKARNGRFHKAIPEYSAAIQANDQYAPAYWRRGSANWELGNYGAAIEDYNTLYNLDPKMSHSESARKHKLMAREHKRRSRPAWGIGHTKPVSHDKLSSSGTRRRHGAAAAPTA